MGVRDGVIVQIEAHVRALVRWDIHALLTWEGLGGQREQSRLFFFEARAHAASAIFRTRPLGGLARAPGERLRVLIRPINESPSCEETFACKSNCPLDASLLTSSQLHVIRSMRHTLFGSR